MDGKMMTTNGQFECRVATRMGFEEYRAERFAAGEKDHLVYIAVGLSTAHALELLLLNYKPR